LPVWPLRVQPRARRAELLERAPPARRARTCACCAARAREKVLEVGGLDEAALRRALQA